MRSLGGAAGVDEDMSSPGAGTGGGSWTRTAPPASAGGEDLNRNVCGHLTCALGGHRRTVDEVAARPARPAARGPLRPVAAAVGEQRDRLGPEHAGRPPDAVPAPMAAPAP